MQAKNPSQNSHIQSASVSNNTQITIGYYNLRGKGQVPRLLLQYLKVQYEDKLFAYGEWVKYSEQHKDEFQFLLLPYLKEGNFVVTDSVPICNYIINRFGSKEMLGKTLQDRAIIDMYIWTIPYMDNVISINCQEKSEQQLKKFKRQQWRVNVFPRLKKIQEAASAQGWFLGYLTIIDFSIYELVRYMENIFQSVEKDLPKLKRIETDIGRLPSIKEYQFSQRAITEWSPSKIIEEMKAYNSKVQLKSENQEKPSKKSQK